MPSLKRKISNGSSTYLSYLIPTFFCTVAGLDFANDGQIDKTLLGFLFIIAMASLGYRVDGFINEVADRVSSDKADKDDKINTTDSKEDK